MSDEQFNELAGRIEGVGRALMGMVAELERAGIIDGPRYCDGLEAQAEALHFSRPHLAATQRTLREMAEELDRARRHRAEGGPA